tara:strand:- start:360 stop:1043 length:684 start_codon:yes stop_codon:yes gene_type:complete
MSQWERFVDTFFNRAVIIQYLPDIFQGIWITLELSILIVIFGTLLGSILAVLRVYKIFPLSLIIIVFADVFRALPPLVLILIVFFGLPNAGIYLSSFLVLFVVLTLVLAAFAEEILWAGLTSVDKGQWEAARSSGLSLNQTLIWIILPQAFKLAIPPLTNRAIAITKMTALGTVIGVPDILNQATTAQSFSGNASPLMIAAIAYVLIFLPLVIASRVLEEKFAWRKA